MVGLRTVLARGSYGAADEDSFRERYWNGAAFYTSRQQHDDLALVVKRFPGRPEIDPKAEPRTFVLVPGLGVSSRYFQPLAAELARRGRVFLVDMPGYGAAANPRRDVTLADHADVLAAFLRESRIENPVLVGHSMGSEIVAIAAQRDPEVSDRIVLMSPTLEPTSRTAGVAIRNLLHDALREPPAVFGIAFTDYIIRCGPPYLLAQLKHMLADRIEDRMPSLTARVLVVAGDRDTIVSVDWAASLAALVRHAEFHVVHGPHVIMHTDPAMIAKHVVDFVDESATEPA
ncbi:MAG TPA: alpha/beta hydrolase [Pseudolysinimonas sp.]|jgi:pimeloyl-ACP methyl ester carboxylesterase